MALNTGKRITIIGCGPGGEGWLGETSRAAIESAEVVAGTPSLLQQFAPAGAEQIAVRADIEEALDLLAACGNEKRIAVLVTGDPGICSLARPVLRRFGVDQCRVIPGISAVQAAFAALALDWTEARVVGAHAQPPPMPPVALINTPLVAVLTGHSQTGPWLQQLAGLPGCQWRIHACRDLTLETERIEQVTLETLPEAARAPRTVIVLERRGEGRGAGGETPDARRPTPGELASPLAPRPSSLGTFYGIGTGPGDSGWLTVKGASILGSCPHVFAPKARIKSESLALSIAQPYVGATATVHEQLFPMTKDEDELSAHWREAADAIATVLEGGEDACFLTIGDPMLYSTYVYLLRALRERLPSVAVETVPGVTSFCAAASLTNFTLGERKEPLTIIPAADDLGAVERALASQGTVVLMKIGGRLPEILDLLRKRKLIDQAVLVARAGQPEERVVTDLDHLSPEEAANVGYLSVILAKGKRDDGQGTRGDEIIGILTATIQTLRRDLAKTKAVREQEATYETSAPSSLVPRPSPLVPPASSPLVTFVGAGPGDPELMTLKAARLLRECQCCIYAGSLVSPEVIGLLPENCEKHDSAEMTLEQTTEACRNAIERGLSVVRLHSGDPSIYGAIREQMNELDKLGIAYEVVPGVSSFQATAAALKTELTAPEVSQTIILTRDSGRTPLPPEQELSKLGAAHATLCVFLSVQGIGKVVDALLPHYGATCPVAVVYRASWPDQHIVRGTLADIAGKVKQAGISRTAMIVVGQALNRDIPVSKLYDAEFTHGYRKGVET
jgi:precorrin-4/cobalt-precorrin-4 C11-methyltransferase